MDEEINQDVKCIIISHEIRERILEELNDPYMEKIVFLFGKNQDGKLVSTDLLVPSRSDYKHQSGGHVHVKPEYVASAFPQQAESGLTLIATIHSHPPGLHEPSDPDIGITHRNVIEHYPSQLTGVYDHNQLSFYQLKEGETSKVKELNMDPERMERFDRQIGFLGTESQMILSSLTVLLIGVGGGNTRVAKDLACMGVDKMILVDPDRWEPSNRNRVFIPPEYIGWNKAESVSRIIGFSFPDVKTEAHKVKIQELPAEVYEGVDLLVVGPDTVTGRIHGNRITLEHEIPAIFPAAGITARHGEKISLGGTVQVVVPGETPCYECIADIDQLTIQRETLSEEQKQHLTQKYLLGDLLDTPTAPSVVSLNALIAGIAVQEVQWLFTDLREYTPFQVYRDGVLRPVKISPKPNCPACGEVSKEGFSDLSNLEIMLNLLDLKENE